MVAVECVGTDLIFGEIAFRDIQTKDFKHRCVYDRSDTDLLYHEVEVEIETLLSDDLTDIGAQVAGQSIAEKTKWLQGRLHPRQDVELFVGGNSILKASADPQSEYRDVNNGPKVHNLNVTHIAGYKSFRISFNLKIARVFCGAESAFGQSFNVQQNQEVLNNRWSIIETRNRNYFMTRQVVGLLRVAHSSIWPHAMRHLVLPQLVRGYRRDVMEFVQSVDGLELSYTIIDEQRYAAPPRPAIDWIRATHVEQLLGGGGQAAATVTVGLAGAPGTPKSHLLTACAKVVENRLGDLRQIDSSVLRTNVMGAVITDYMNENSVELSVDVIHTELANEENQLFYIGVIFDKLGKLPGVQDGDPAREDEAHWNADIWPNPIPYDGNTPAGIFATYLQTPCDSYHGMPYVHEGDTQNEQPPTYGEQQNPTIRVYEGEPRWRTDEIAKVHGNVSNEQKDFPYIISEIESKYLTRSGFVAAPIADTGSNDAVFVGRLHRPVATNTIYMRAKRIGQQPRIPNLPETFTDNNGIRHYLDTKEILPQPPELMPAANSYLFKVEVAATYLMSRAPRDNEILRVGSLPWDNTNTTGNQYRISENSTETLL